MGKRCFNLQLLVFNSTFSFLWKQTKTEKEYSTPCAIKLSFYELWWYYSFFHNRVACSIWDKGYFVLSSFYCNWNMLRTTVTCLWKSLAHLSLWHRTDSQTSLWSCFIGTISSGRSSSTEEMLTAMSVK